MKFLSILGLFVLLTLTSGHAQEAPPPQLSDYFGFHPVEIYKVANRSLNLLAADLNTDGKTDLASGDDSHSRIDLLVQRGEKPASEEKPTSANDILSDRRYEHQKLPVDRALSTIVAGDFDSDSRTDLAYLGSPDRLIIRIQPEKSKEWKILQTIRLPEMLAGMWTLASGDLNSDGKTDLAVLAKSVTYILYQKPDGGFGSPVSLMNTSEQLGLLMVADMDGDEKDDLIYMASADADRTVCIRQQLPKGGIGPEIQFQIPFTHAMTIAEINGQVGKELLSIDTQTNRIRVSGWTRPLPQVGELSAQLIQYGFGKANPNRGFAIGDLNQDGLSDVVVSDPDGAQVIYYEQLLGTGPNQGTLYPSLNGVTQVKIEQPEGGTPELFVLSPKEKSLGVSRMNGARLSFPDLLEIKGEPLLFELMDLNKDGVREVVYIARERSPKSAYFLRALKRTKAEAGGSLWVAEKFGEKDQVELTSLKSDPERVITADLDSNGSADLLVFPSGSDRPALLLMAGENGELQEKSTEGNVGLTGVSSGAVYVQQGQPATIYAAQGNFARSMKLVGNKWQVLDQYNALESTAKIGSALPIDLDGQPGLEMALVDTGSRRIRVYRLEDQVYREWREIEIGQFPLITCTLGDLNGDNRPDLILFGSSKFGVIYAAQSDPKLAIISNFETKLENTRFADLIAGDLNNDGRTDVVAIDIKSQFVEILTFTPNTGLTHAVSFKVFEAKSFSGDDSSGIEPREGLISDVTGDGLADLVLLTHDRILIYPQDSGETE